MSKKAKIIGQDDPEKKVLDMETISKVINMPPLKEEEDSEKEEEDSEKEEAITDSECGV